MIAGEGYMNSESRATNVYRRLTERFGNPLEWSYVDKCLSIIVSSLVMSIPNTIFMAVMYYVEPLLHNALFAKLLIFGLAWSIVFLLLAAIGFLIRQKTPQARWFMYSCIIWLNSGALWGVWYGGHSTNPFTYLFMLAIALGAYLLLDSISFILTIVMWVVGLGSVMVAEQLGFLYYAPLFPRGSFAKGSINGLYVLACVIFGGAIMTIELTGIVYIINRWRRREAQVKELSELLKKMFGRYLSTEVMNKLIGDPSALELGGERREVTIMMTDLRGFTALSERLPPEQVVRMLNAYFEVMIDLVLAYGGTINEIIGDALLIVFGAPQEMPDRAQRGIACAIAMQNAMVRINEENRSQGLPELEMGIGLNEAEVIVGNIGSTKRSKYAVVGSGVNMASRIESYTVGGQILISESVRNKAGDMLRIDARRDVLPKGAESALRIYEVGGIAGTYNLNLEVKDSVLVALARQIPVWCAPLEGKHIGKERIKGFILRLSKKSAEITLEEPIEALVNLRINLEDVEDDLLTKDFYGKVIEGLGMDGHLHLIRFTALPPEVSVFFQAFRQHAAKEAM